MYIGLAYRSCLMLIAYEIYFRRTMYTVYFPVIKACVCISHVLRMYKKYFGVYVGY